MKKQEKHKKKRMHNSALTVEGTVSLLRCTSNTKRTYNHLHKYTYLCLVAEMLDSSTFKRFSAALDNILENLEDVDLSAAGKPRFPRQ